MIVGIDLGTTNSAVAYWSENKAQLIPNSLGDVLTPSAVSLGEDGEVLVGLAARERQSTHPDRTATAFKRLMGTQQPVTLGGTRFSPEDLSSLVLASLKRDAEAALGQEVTGAVITVPAYFNDRQRKATRRAGRLAGLTVERLVNEPTAAALAYGIVDREDRAPFLVFDLGGGTFDVSIVEMYEGVVEVRATAGDNRLGGEDFNDVLAEMARQKLNLPCPSSDPRLRETLRVAAERCRRALSQADRAPFALVWREEALEVEVPAADFEATAAPLIERLRAPVLRAMRDSDVRAETMSEIVMVGGATRMPLVRRAVTRMFSRFPNSGIDPDTAVALGAAVQAGLKARDVDLAEVRLTDVCPYTLGVDVMERDRAGIQHGGIFAPIIERNTVLPASRVHRFQTAHDQQAMVEFGIYQGEARLVSANVPLGEVRVPIPRRPAGAVLVDCRFSYDVSGLLEVDVTVPGTDIAEQLVIYDDEAAREDDLPARREALAALKVHPRDQDANRALLARAERCYEGFIGERREMVGQLIAHFEAALASQDPRTIGLAAEEVAGHLDRLEGERYL
jgi:molecular chaperone HscC